MNQKLESARVIVKDYQGLKKILENQESKLSDLKNEKNNTREPLFFGKEKYNELINELNGKLEVEEIKLKEIQEKVSSLEEAHDNASDIIQRHEEEENRRVEEERKKLLTEIFESTLVEPNLNPSEFGNKIINYATKTNTSYYDAVKFICDSFGKNLNVLVTTVLIEKYKNSEENLFNIVKDLNRLNEQKKINFDAAAKFISEEFHIPIGRIMNMLFAL